MLPTNVVSFVKKMVASDGGSSSSSRASGSSRGNSSHRGTEEAESTLSRLRQTLTSGIHGTVTKLSPSRPSFSCDSGISSSSSSLSSGAAGGISTSSLSSTSTVSFEERSLLQKVWNKTEKFEPPDHREIVNPPPISTPTAPVGGTFSPLNPPMNGSSRTESLVPKVLRPPGSNCRVCVKTITATEFYKTCSECNQKVCEDCASYSSSKDDIQSFWHCSICRRKLLSQTKKINTNNRPQVFDSGGSLMGTLPENPSSAQPLSVSLGTMSVSSNSSKKVNAYQHTGENKPVIAESSNIVATRDSRRNSSMNIAQRSMERSTSKEEMQEKRPSILRKSQEVGQRNQTSLKKSDNAKDFNQTGSADRRGHRASDFNVGRETHQEDKIKSSLKKKEQTEYSTGKTKNTNYSGESSEENVSPDSQRGRRKSIQRQKSCDEEGEDSTLLNLWSMGQLPIRRHSAQDPSRQSNHPDFQRSKESLDVPQGRVHRHHSWDYDVSRGNQSMQDSLLPNANPAQCSRFSSESDMSNESPSERGSTVNLEDQRRGASVSRRSSYRGVIRAEETEEQPQNKGSSLDGTSKGSTKNTGSSSLEDDLRLHPTEEEYRSNRRRSSAVSDSGRVLPTPPASPRISTYCSWGSGSSGGYGRSSQSIESSSSRDMGDESLRKQGSVTDGEAIKIVIHDVDTPFKLSKTTQKDENRRKVKIKRDRMAYRAGGLGMRIVGGKTTKDGKLIATVVWIVPDGPADCAGVRQGDKVLEWNGVNLLNRSFEDVCSIIEADEATDVIDVMLETSPDGYVDNRDDNPLIQSQRGSLETRVSLDGDLEKSLMSVSRRKLPKIPGDVQRLPVSGKLQVQLWYEKNNLQLISTIISAHDLRLRERYVTPEAFVSLRVFPHRDSSVYTTPVAEPSTKPLWNSSFSWENISGDALMGMTLEMSVWDSIRDGDNGFLGECLIDLRHSYLDERPTWYRLQERRSRSANTTPRGSIAGPDFTLPTVRRPSSVRSGSEDHHETDDSRHSSIDSGLLHPDLAWRDSRSNSRRGSSVSEQAEIEIYQLTRSYPHSLPQSRRSSFTNQSSGSPELKGSVKFQRPEDDQQHAWRSNLGPGQVVPRAYRDILTDDFTLGEIRLELSQTRGCLEVEVSNARGLPAADSGHPPDTYVKTYLKEGDKRINKRKTRIIRQSKTPNFYQTLRYHLQDLRGRSLLVMVWEKQGHKHVGLGVSEIAVNKLELRRPSTGWYRLLPLSSVDRIHGSDSD